MDTGASISIIRADFCKRLRKVKTPYSGHLLRGANDTSIQPSAFCTVRVSIDGLCHHIQCAVISECPYKLILGWDFLSSTSAVICCRTPAISITDVHHSAVPETSTPRLVLRTNHVVPARQEHILSVSADKIVDGDVLAIPCGRLLS